MRSTAWKSPRVPIHRSVTAMWVWNGVLISWCQWQEFQAVILSQQPIGNLLLAAVQIVATIVRLGCSLHVWNNIVLMVVTGLGIWTHPNPNVRAVGMERPIFDNFWIYLSWTPAVELRLIWVYVITEAITVLTSQLEQYSTYDTTLW